MDFDKEYKTVVYIDKNNQVVIKFNGFKDKKEADNFSQFISWELGIEFTLQYDISLSGGFCLKVPVIEIPYKPRALQKFCMKKSLRADLAF